MIRILLADDHELMLAALSSIIERRDDMRVIGTAMDGGQAVAKAIEMRPDVIIMDVRMPGMTGVHAIQRVLGRWPHPTPPPRILVLTTFDVDEYVHAALRAGASGFLLKNSTPDQLATAIRAVADGDAMLAPSVTARLIQTVTVLPPSLLTERRPAPPVLALTTREREVLVLIARGLSNAQIAGELSLTEANTKSRINRLLNKLGLRNRVQAAVLAHESGLV
ncbi:response regulator [Nonomuraea sp. JJY05]|uniref:response regulator n=1 Tax=Nonomuraea sp. JJY05 TaxID=3350255 RepID=UPI00373FC588